MRRLMRTVNEWLWASVRQELVTLPEADALARQKLYPPWVRLPEELFADPELERLRMNRLIMGVYRYERLGINRDYDRIGAALEHKIAFLRDKNREHLVDVINLFVLEMGWPSTPGTGICSDRDLNLPQLLQNTLAAWMDPRPGEHFRSIDDGEHAKESE